MNDNELRRRLAQLAVPRTDPAAVDGALHRALTVLNHPAKTQPRTSIWTWRDWLWPSPLAWSAMATLWVFVVVNLADRPARGSSEAPAIAQHKSEGPSPLYPLFARSNYRALLREMQGPSRSQ